MVKDCIGAVRGVIGQEEGEKEGVKGVSGRFKGPSLAVILEVPDSGALVSVPARDVGEGVHGRLQNRPYLLLEGVLRQVAGSSGGVTAVQYGLKGYADFSGEEVGFAISSGLQLLLAIHYSLLHAGVTSVIGSLAGIPLEARTRQWGGRPLEPLH